MEFGGVASFSFVPEPPSSGTRSEPLTCLPRSCQDAGAQVWSSFDTTSGEDEPSRACSRPCIMSCSPGPACSDLQVRDLGWRLKPGAATGCP